MSAVRGLIAVAALLLLVAGCGGSGRSRHGGAAASPPQLRNIQELQRAFDSASHEPTLVVLVAPT